MYTQCPTCRALFRLHSGVAATQGAVECTVCSNIFDCADSLVATPQEAIVGPSDEMGRHIDYTIALAKPYSRAAPELERESPPTREFSLIESSEDSANEKRSIGAVIGGFFAGLAGLALRNVVRNRRRSAFAFLAIAFGVVAVLLAGGFIEWMLWATREAAIHSQLGHLQIVKPGYLKEGQAAPFEYLLPDEAPELQTLSKDPAVQTIAPRLFLTGLISRGDTTVSFLGQGVDPDREHGLTDSITVEAGNDLDSKHPKEIVMGTGLAKSVGAEIGDSVILLANTAEGGLNAVEVRVRGLFFTSSKAFDDAALRIPLDTARELSKVKGSHTWIVLLRDTALTDTYLNMVRETLSGLDVPLDIVPWYDLADFYNKTAQLLKSQVDLVAIVIALLILLSISNTLTMGVMERTSEIGTLMAIGVRRAKILRLFLSEGVILGLSGALTGLALGLLLATIISAIGIPMPPPPGMSVGYTAKIMVTQSLSILGVALAAGAALLASVYPAYKASRMEIVNALRHNR